MPKKSKRESNLPEVSKQTAGGITGAVIGGVVAGPVGAVAGGVAGALVGNSSAKGNKPIKRAVATLRAKLPGAGSPTTEVQGIAARTPKKAKKKPAAKKPATTTNDEVSKDYQKEGEEEVHAKVQGDICRTNQGR